MTIIKANSTMQACCMKMELWKLKISECNFAMFPTLYEFVDVNNESYDIKQDLSFLGAMKEHVLIITEEIASYFPKTKHADINHIMQQPFYITY